MSCYHCEGKEVDGFTCSFCLGDDHCGYHDGDEEACMGLVTDEQKAKYKALIEGGNVFCRVCEDCGAVVAGCDYTDGDDEPCGKEAYKWVDHPTDEKKCIYFCETHGQIPEFLEHFGFVGEWAAYQPGEEGCGCDFPY